MLGSQATYIVYTMPVFVTYEMIRDYNHTVNRVGLGLYLVYTVWLVQTGYDIFSSLFYATIMTEFSFRSILLTMLLVNAI